MPAQVLKDLKFDFKPKAKFYHGKGCKMCRQTGYLGRMGVTEILAIDDEVREMLIKGASSDDIKKYAIEKQHMATLWEDAMRKFSDGLTTVEEVLRITSND